MSGLFLGPLRPEDLQAVAHERLHLQAGYAFVASGHWALRLLLRRLHLPQGGRVAIPVLICPTVVAAIFAEGLQPVFMDVDPEGHQMIFHRDHFHKSALDALILPHLYGMRHPQTQEVMAYAEGQNIPLLHDAAQSYGLQWQGRPLMEHNQGGFESFGPGKSTTAATGARVYGLGEAFAAEWGLHRWRWWNGHEKGFMRQRMGLTVKERWLVRSGHSMRACRLQVRAANLVMKRFSAIESKRLGQWRRLQEIVGRELYGEIPEGRSYYKYIINAPASWQPPPELAGVPWRRVEKYYSAPGLTHYDRWQGHLFELSTERTLEEYGGGGEGR